MEILKKRVNDGSINRLIYQWLKAGVIDGDHLFKPESGVPQGNIISPLLSNIYLYEVLDSWLEEIRPMLRGEMFFIRLLMIMSSASSTGKTRGGYLTPFQSALISMVLPFTRERPGFYIFNLIIKKVPEHLTFWGLRIIGEGPRWGIG